MHKRVATNGTHGSTLGELAGDLVCSILPTLDTQYIVVHTNGDLLLDRIGAARTSRVTQA